MIWEWLLESPAATEGQFRLGRRWSFGKVVGSREEFEKTATSILQTRVDSQCSGDREVVKSVKKFFVLSKGNVGATHKEQRQCTYVKD